MKCPVCHKAVPESAERCPWCGKDLRAGAFPRKLVMLFLLLVVAALALHFLRHLPNPTPHGKSSVERSVTSIGLLPLQTQSAKTDSLDSLVREVNGFLLVHDCARAIPLLERILAVRNDLQGEMLLGQCFVRQGAGARARAHLQKIPAGQFVDLQVWLDKAAALDREDSEMGQLESPHFHLWVEGKISTWNARDTLFQALEIIYDQLCLSFNYYPDEKIFAVLYQSGRYQQSGLPDWTGALFDGKVRIPYNVLERWPAHRSVLVHEVAHAFIHDIAQGPVPPWLDEGLAQILDQSAYDPARLASLGSAPLPDLSQQFLKHADRTEALRLYLTSLGMCRLLWPGDPYRANAFREVRDFLQAMEKGGGVDRELDTRYHQSTASLWELLSASLQK